MVSPRRLLLVSSLTKLKHQTCSVGLRVIKKGALGKLRALGLESWRIWG